MKKVIFLLVALVCSMSMNAQVMKVMKNGEEVATYKGTDYSVVFEETPAVPTTGTAKRTGDIDVKWVQLWENGPKFAEYNVGAANNKAEDYGGYYCWGMSIDKDPKGYYKQNTKDPLTGTDDTAINLWGSNWRMPTKAELDNLHTKCDVEWINDYKGDGTNIQGKIFTGKGLYSSNSVFLPAGGRCLFGDIYDSNTGRYWSSTAYDWGGSYYLIIYNSTYQPIQHTNRSEGLFIRAVLAE